MKPTIALFLHQPMCSVQSGNGIIKALEGQYNFKIFTKHELEHGFFKNIDMVAFPGGFGNSDSYDYLLRINGDPIVDFINNGGKYLGICMGAYWAGNHYFKLLEGVEPVQYYKRPTVCTRRPHTKAMPITWNGRDEKMFFNDGCTFVGNPKKFDTYATYSNGEPMAIIQNNLGLIGCHPESEEFWYESYKQIRGHWHHKRHHRLLLEFVNTLMEQ